MSFLGKFTGAALACTMMTGAAMAQDMTFFRIGTGGAGGTYFPIGGIIANAISNPPGSRACEDGGNCGVPGLVAIAQSTNASAHNVNAIQAGQMEAGLSGAATLHFAYHGIGKYEGQAKPDLRIIANLFPEDLHLVMPKDGSLNGLTDLKGKRVGIAQAGSGTQIAVELIIGDHGVNRDNIDEAELNGREAYGGLDLSSSVDLTAAIFVVPSIEKMALNPKKPKEKTSVEVLDVVIRAWTPEDTLEERERTDLAPYSKWVKDGHLLTCPGDVVDYDDIERELFLLAGGIPTGYERLAPDDPYRGVSLELGALNFDRWGSKQLVNHLAEGGLEVWQMGQGFADMSAPMKELERLLRQGRIRHNGNPLLRWAFASLAVRQDPAGNIKPDRDRSTGRIDPFVALVMAIGAWMRAAEAKENKKGSKTVVSY